MRRLIPMIVLGGIALAQASCPVPLSAQGPGSRAADKVAGVSADLPPMPPLPKGETTILGGAIGKVDPVLDQLTLNIYGERPMKIQFDARTKVFRNGAPIPLRELGPADHAAVQTALDGTHVFAVSVHILTQAPQGEAEGVVRSYDRRTGRLEINSALAPQPLSFFVTGNTGIVRAGQREFTSARSGTADLTSGSLITLTFVPGAEGRAFVQHVTVLAVPGSRFIFGGDVSYLDIASGSLVVDDSRDGKSYRIYFSSSRFPSATNLHVGDNVTIDAVFEGARYIATSLTINRK